MTEIIEVTREERNVLDALLEIGGTNAQIAGRLHRSEDTIKCHMKQLLRKTGCATRTELVVAVMRERIKVGSPAITQCSS